MFSLCLGDVLMGWKEPSRLFEREQGWPLRLSLGSDDFFSEILSHLRNFHSISDCYPLVQCSFLHARSFHSIQWRTQ
ncbi:hypothetical protein GBA52_019074 [Prunus armeniaca]|nr:hypothetical protein GBA52_019074 [Prunus armeniaca]